MFVTDNTFNKPEKDKLDEINIKFKVPLNETQLNAP